jgi:serine/threonine protein kinase
LTIPQESKVAKKRRPLYVDSLPTVDKKEGTQERIERDRGRSSFCTISLYPNFKDLQQFCDRNGIQVLGELGQGNFGQVWKVAYKGEVVALKKLKEDSDEMVREASKMRYSLRPICQCDLCRSLQHAHIVEMKELFPKDRIVIMELAAGSLEDILQKDRENLGGFLHNIILTNL